MLIEARGIYYTYMAGSPFEVNALKNISLQINRGEFIGIIGETGSGKSTLIQHFNGLLKPTAGEVYYNGSNIWDEEIDLRKLRSRLALLFQYPEHQLFEETVFKDVAFGPKSIGMEGEQLEERVHDALMLVGIDFERYGQRSPFSLSDGEKRKVAMAGVLAMQPEVLILDEPAAGMDPLGKRRFIELLQQLHYERGITVILVTHDMEEVSSLAEKIFVISNGELVLQGKPAEVFSQFEKLREVGLDIPPLAALMYELNNCGKDVRTDVFTVEEVGKEILKLYDRQ